MDITNDLRLNPQPLEHNLPPRTQLRKIIWQLTLVVNKKFNEPQFQSYLNNFVILSKTLVKFNQFTL